MVDGACMGGIGALGEETKRLLGAGTKGREPDGGITGGLSGGIIIILGCGCVDAGE